MDQARATGTRRGERREGASSGGHRSLRESEQHGSKRIKEVKSTMNSNASLLTPPKALASQTSLGGVTSNRWPTPVYLVTSSCLEDHAPGRMVDPLVDVPRGLSSERRKTPPVPRGELKPDERSPSTRRSVWDCHRRTAAPFGPRWHPPPPRSAVLKAVRTGSPMKRLGSSSAFSSRTSKG